MSETIIGKATLTLKNLENDRVAPGHLSLHKDEKFRQEASTQLGLIGLNADYSTEEELGTSEEWQEFLMLIQPFLAEIETNSGLGAEYPPDAIKRFQNIITKINTLLNPTQK